MIYYHHELEKGQTQKKRKDRKMKKIEFSAIDGIEFVDTFGKDTKVWKKDILTIQDVIDHISRPFDGVIGWEATEEDIEALKDAEFLK